jgi:hypothetical protein
MKKLVRASALIVAGLGMFAFTNSIRGTDFEGVIKFETKVDNADDPKVAQYAPMFSNSTTTTYVKGDMVRVESGSPMYLRIEIMNKKKPDERTTLVIGMGKKYQVKMTDADKKEDSESKVDFKYLDGTKTIAGYACKEAQATMKDKQSGDSYTSDIYYTDQLPYGGGKFKDLKGFPMSFTQQIKGVKMTMTVKSIDKQSVPDSLFTVPAGYKLMTPQEIQMDMFGGGGGN